ncbi:MAG: hypothetical protein PHX05_05800, partial [Acidobacteriota bacterium]|nr:hypothetical protein [Acidobacteriota bacterium]
FCSRLLLEKINPVCVEPKSSMKGRTGKSPDDADSKVVLTELVRERLGIAPGVDPDRSMEYGQSYPHNELDDPDKTYSETPEQAYAEQYA